MDYALTFLDSFSPLSRTCQPHDSFPNFKAAEYMGSWYEQVHTIGSAFQPNDTVCNQVIYTDLTSEGRFKIYNSGQSALGAKRGGVHGDAYCPDSTGDCYAKFFVQLSDHPNYMVIDTDYTTYSVIYQCNTANCSCIVDVPAASLLVML